MGFKNHSCALLQQTAFIIVVALSNKIILSLEITNKVSAKYFSPNVKNNNECRTVKVLE